MADSDAEYQKAVAMAGNGQKEVQVNANNDAIDRTEQARD
jgi:hypothetical protein